MIEKPLPPGLRRLPDVGEPWPLDVGRVFRPGAWRTHGFGPFADRLRFLGYGMRSRRWYRLSSLRPVDGCHAEPAHVRVAAADTQRPRDAYTLPSLAGDRGPRVADLAEALMSDDDTRPAPNGVSCADCPGFGHYYQGERGCPEDPEHYTEPVFITKTPLGWADDDQYLVAARGIYVYDAEQFDTD